MKLGYNNMEYTCIVKLKQLRPQVNTFWESKIYRYLENLTGHEEFFHYFIHFKFSYLNNHHVFVDGISKSLNFQGCEI